MGAIRRKNLNIDEDLLHQAQRVLGTRTETETVAEALKAVVVDEEAWEAMARTAGRGRGHFTFADKER